MKSFSPISRICTTYLKNKASQWRRILQSIFKQVEQSDLQKSIEALKVHMATNPLGTVSYTKQVKYLITAVSECPEYVSRNRSVSDVSTGDGDQDSAYKSGGTINTGYIPNWISFLNADKKKVIYERNK